MTSRHTASLRARRASLSRSAVCVALLLAAVAGSRADASPGTVAALIAQAQRDDPGLRAARAEVEVARARLLQAGLRPNPRLELSARNDWLFGNDGEHSESIGLSQELPMGGRLQRQQDVAQLDVAIAETGVAEAGRQLAATLAADAYRLPVLERQLARVSALIEVESKLAQATRARLRAAEVSEIDVNSVQLELQRLQLERAQLLAQRDAQIAALQARLGVSVDAAQATPRALPALTAPADLAGLQQRARTHRPDLRVARLGVERAHSTGALARSSRWQDWTIGLELAQDKSVIQGAPTQPTDRSLGISLSIPLPLHDPAPAALAEASASEAQAQARLEALQRQVDAEVAAAQAELARRAAGLEQYAQGLLPLAARTVALAQQGYRQGLVTIFEVVQAQRQESELQAAQLESLDAFLQAWVRLHAAIGDEFAAATTADANPEQSP